MIYIGIDSGVNTGVAVWASKNEQSVHESLRGSFVCVATKDILEAMDIVLMWPNAKLYIEDARRATHKRQGDAFKAQGAGSVKRDASIWEAFAKKHGFEYVLCRPKKHPNWMLGKDGKITPEAFAKITGFHGRTSSHARDAALLVFGMK